MEKLIGAAILMICRVVSCTWNAVFLDKVLIKGGAKLQVSGYTFQVLPGNRCLVTGNCISLQLGTCNLDLF